jgi:hypothetical protein
MLRMIDKIMENSRFTVNSIDGLLVSRLLSKQRLVLKKYPANKGRI